MTAAVEGSLSAEQVRAGAVVLEYRPPAHTAREVVSGFYVRLSNCVGPTDEPVVVGLRYRGQLVQERASIPVYGWPLNLYTRSDGGKAFPPLDVGQEYRVALPAPLAVRPGDVLSVEVLSCGELRSGITAGLQRQGTWPLLEMREPFRPTKAAGPVCRINWSAPEVVCRGNQKRFDPLCAPQNNSGVVADADGTLYQFSAFYSVDEQYGGGREGSYSRTFAFRKRPGAREWELLGQPFDLPEAITYIGDPFAFRDLDGRPCLLYTMVDGTKGFVDWQYAWGCLRRSASNSVAGPWEEAHFFWERLPRNNDDDRPIALRIFPRIKTGDYILVWQHGGRDITIRALQLPELKTRFTHEQMLAAPVLVRNQEEGGGGFVRGDKGYASTWQIPSINDVTSVQRLYEFDLADALSPESWRVVPGSCGFNDGTNPAEDGGATADSWSLSMLGDELWATSVGWSVSDRRNATLARHVPWDRRLGETFRYGVSRVQGYHEVAPVVEYAVGEECSLQATITAVGQDASIIVALAPSARPLLWGGIALQVCEQGSRLVAYSDTGQLSGLTPFQSPRFAAGRAFRVELTRHGEEIRGTVDGQTLGPVTVTGPAQRKHLAEPQRFKLYGWQGGLYTVRDAVLRDGR